jgi:hypothetical protein
VLVLDQIVRPAPAAAASATTKCCKTTSGDE